VFIIDYHHHTRHKTLARRLLQKNSAWLPPAVLFESARYCSV